MTTNQLPGAAEAANLTEALRRSGALIRGHVRNVRVSSSLNKPRSLNLRLSLTYEGLVGHAPPSVFLKSGRLDSDGKSFNLNHREIAFYRDIASAMPSNRHVARCFDFFSDDDTKTWHILLEDLTDTHVIATEWPLPPATVQCESVVEALAGFHAAWWDDSRLGITVGTWRDIHGWEQLLRRFAKQFTRFTDEFGEIMPAHRRPLYERLLEEAPRLLGRYFSRRNLTIIHGDAHSWNCFMPRDAGSKDVRLIDWENWSINTAADDLAYMMAMLWYPDRRRRIERSLLDRYHATLLAHGVSGYDRAALGDDYRLSVLWLITRPVWQAAAKVPPRVWWNNLERILMAVDDLGCDDLLG